MHTFDPRAQEAEAGESQFEASLVYRGIPREAVSEVREELVDSCDGRR